MSRTTNTPPTPAPHRWPSLTASMTARGRLRRMIVGIVTVASAVSTCLGVTASSATAAEKVMRDQAGDAPVQYDIRRVTLMNGPRYLTFRVKVGDLRVDENRYALVVGFWTQELPAQDLYVLFLTRRPDGHRDIDLLYFEGDQHRHVSCPQLAYRFAVRKDRIWGQIPQRCLVDEGVGDQTVVTEMKKREALEPLDKTAAVTVAYR